MIPDHTHAVIDRDSRRIVPRHQRHLEPIAADLVEERLKVGQL